MRTRIGLILLLATTALCGCGSDTPAVPAEALKLTPEQAAAIKKQDEAVRDEEGGPEKVTKPGRRAR